MDRLGRSLQDLLSFLGELHAKEVDLYLHQQGLDTSTPAGKALFQMMGVFAEFERAIIRERVRSGLERAKTQGKVLGRRRNDDPKRLASVRRLRKKGVGIGKIARTLGDRGELCAACRFRTQSKLNQALDHGGGLKEIPHLLYLASARLVGIGVSNGHHLMSNPIFRAVRWHLGPEGPRRCWSNPGQRSQLPKSFQAASLLSLGLGCG